MVYKLPAGRERAQFIASLETCASSPA